jgi:hypothetical protein
MNPEQQKLLEQLFALDNQGDAVQEPTKAEQILNAFVAMNISSLEILLDDSKTYQDATKEVFLEKLVALFLAHKKIGDDYFIVYQGKCGADCSLCPNSGKSGYRFVGNHSNNYFDFIFELVGQNISDIYDCSRFETTETIENLESKANLDFDDDEKAYFVKTPEYLIKVNAAQEAFSEISTSPPQLLDFEQLSYWVDKYDSLYESTGGYDVFQSRFKWSPFASLYSDLKEIKDYLDTHFQQIQVSYTQFSHLETEQDYLIKNSI